LIFLLKGVVIYELAYNEVPFPEESHWLKRYEILKDLEFIKTPPNPERSLALRSLIESMLIVDKSKRISFQEIRKNPYFEN
jgi:serine/threonine protein kinase